MVCRSHRFKIVDPTLASSIESMFRVEEIKNVVWDCGLDRAPRPDGFTFCFIGHFWDLLGNDVIAFV